MPELAAHLERVAKELSEQVVRALFDQGYLTGPTQDRLDAEDIAGEALKAGLAAALAACAREASETESAKHLSAEEVAQAVNVARNLAAREEAKWWQENGSSWRLKEQFERLAALERAVGESKMVPPVLP